MRVKTNKHKLLNIFENHIISIEIKSVYIESNYQEFAFQALIDVHEIGYNNTFIYTSDLILVTILEFGMILDYTK